jgi:hypothetical protein
MHLARSACVTYLEAMPLNALVAKQQRKQPLVQRSTHSSTRTGLLLLLLLLLLELCYPSFSTQHDMVCTTSMTSSSCCSGLFICFVILATIRQIIITTAISISKFAAS